MDSSVLLNISFILSDFTNLFIVSKCCFANISVGAIIALWYPEFKALIIAIIALTRKEHFVRKDNTIRDLYVSVGGGGPGTIGWTPNNSMDKYNIKKIIDKVYKKINVNQEIFDYNWCVYILNNYIKILPDYYLNLSKGLNDTNFDIKGNYDFDYGIQEVFYDIL